MCLSILVEHLPLYGWHSNTCHVTLPASCHMSQLFLSQRTLCAEHGLFAPHPSNLPYHAF